jgi:diacylglycerol kinase
MKLGIRGHSSFFVHFFFAAFVVAAAAVLRCGWVEWSLLLGCIGLVLVAELFNSAIETLVRNVDESMRPQLRPALNVAAGAVLLACGTAALVGLIVLGRSLSAYLFPPA